MMINWKTEARGRRQRLTLTPYLDIRVDKLSVDDPKDPRYSIFIFGTTFCVECSSEDFARDFALMRAREILSEGLAKLGVKPGARTKDTRTERMKE